MRASKDASKISPCCAPTGAGCAATDAHDPYLAAALAVPRADPDTQRTLRAALSPIPGGIFEMGARISTFAADHDSPRRKVRVSPFHIAPTCVTNAEFARFVAATGYRTIAEREGWSFVFHLLLQDPGAWPVTPPGLPWWRKVDGAFWAAPEGPGSDWSARADHPAVHIAWFDAIAYCTWGGLRLPWEAEWERAARGGVARQKFPWGNSLTPNGAHSMNIWQGDFPHTNTAEDGFLGTAPVTAFAPNAYGLWNMTGNVWEWVGDVFGPPPPPGKMPQMDPHGPDKGPARVQRGGSFLCHVSYCDRYHVHSRTRNDPDSATSNSGFRVACAVQD